MDLAKLKTELTTDPLGKGYASMSDEAIAAAFAVRDREVGLEQIDGGLLVSCIARGEFGAATLSPNDREYVRLLAATATPIPLDAALRQDLISLFPGNSATRVKLQKVLKRMANRAEELGLDGVPTPSDVADAKRA